MNQPEHEFQKVVVRYLNLKKIPFFAVPNGGKRNPITAKKLKAEGVLAGVADLFIMIGNSKYHGLFLELKIKPNSQEVNQKKFEDLAKNNHYCYKLAFNIDEVIEILDIYLKIV